jgi:pimeloyl-ACP methyl ester carboxylesterase
MLSFTQRGNGPALVLIHAFPLDSSMWHAQVEFFSERYRVITPDIIGFGGSQPPHEWTIPEMGGELLDLLDRLQIEKCTLIGLSVGGYISLPFAFSNPNRVEHLVLAHTRARADLENERTARDSVIEGLRTEGISTLPDKMLPRLLGPSATSDVRDFVRNSIQRVSPQAAIDAIIAMRDRANQTAELQFLRCPTLVIAGSDDAIVPVEDCKRMAAAIPHGDFTLITNTGHLSNLEDPVAFNNALDTFLKRYDSE